MWIFQVRLPDHEVPWDVFLTPFSNEMWAAAAMCALVAAAVFMTVKTVMRHFLYFLGGDSFVATNIPTAPPPSI